MRSWVRWIGSFGAVLAVSVVRAAPPPVGEPGPVHGFVEPCVMSNVQERHLECEPCRASREQPKACGTRLLARGFEKKCRTHGDQKGWEEIWCKSRVAEKPSWTTTLWVVLAAGGTLAAMALFMRVLMRPSTK